MMAAFENWLFLAVSISTTVSLFLFLLPDSYNGKRKAHGRCNPRIQILVLGDIGRSPRMQYHAMSIVKNGGFVDLIGYHDSELHPRIASNPSIIVHAISSAPPFLKTNNSSLFMILGPLKVLFQVASLWLILGYKTSPAKWMLIQANSFDSSRSTHPNEIKNITIILLFGSSTQIPIARRLNGVQNPPSIPTLFIAQIVCFLRNTRLVIDWHNFGYSILALKLGKSHPLVHFSHLYEHTFSRFAAAHFTVTNAMARVLKDSYNVNAPIIALHDRPTSDFHRLDESQRLTFLKTLPETKTYLSEIEKGKLKLLVSSTSWTPDEDFSLLLDALVMYSELAMHTHPHLPRILAVVTGKGPQKADFLRRIAQLEAQDKLEMVVIKTAWLSFDQYANLLGTADLGVSLHTSSSGVDLPMKVVDMFGAGLPVIGWNKFEAWPELVREGVNGIGFGSAVELREILIDLLGGDDSKRQKLRIGAIKEGDRRWDDEWDSLAGKLLGLI